MLCAEQGCPCGTVTRFQPKGRICRSLSTAPPPHLPHSSGMLCFLASSCIAQPHFPATKAEQTGLRKMDLPSCFLLRKTAINGPEELLPRFRSAAVGYGTGLSLEEAEKCQPPSICVLTTRLHSTETGRERNNAFILA